MMSEAIYNIARDLDEAGSLAEHLTPYVHQQELYGSIGGMFSSGSKPALTIGALLMRLHRLHALENQLNDTQRGRLGQIEAQKDAVRKEWTIHYNNKLVQEALSRLKLIERFMSDCDDDKRNCAANYPPEANRRTIVQDILRELESTGADADEVKKTARRIDSRLRRYAQPAEFTLASVLQEAYPKDEYWWLYAKPPRAEAK